MAAGTDTSRIELLVDDPIGKTIHAGYPGAYGTKRGVEIFIAEGFQVFFDMAVGINHAHG